MGWDGVMAPILPWLNPRDRRENRRGFGVTCEILRDVRRAVLVVVLTLVTFNVSGLGALCGDGACDSDESCPTDASGGQCPPNCHLCSCCSLPQMMGAGVVVLIAPPPRGTSWLRSHDRPTSPDPADILHVPKRLLA